MISSDQLKVYWDKYYDRLFRMAFRRTKNECVATEIVQDVFIQLWRIKEVKESSLEAYLCICIANRCTDYFRKIRSDKYGAIVLMEYDEKKYGGYYSLDSIISDRESVESIAKLICDLPEERRKVFELYMAGKKSAEIADILSISKQTALNQKTRAIKWLKSKINER